MKDKAPSNLRIVETVGKSVAVRFDGDLDCNDYRLFARSRPLHGHQPLVDDPVGISVWTQSKDGPKWNKVNGQWQRGSWTRKRRRTWTQIGGYDAGTGASRTQADTNILVVEEDLPDDGPWQLMINLRSDPSGNTHSNVVTWHPPVLED